MVIRGGYGCGVTTIRKIVKFSGGDALASTDANEPRPGVSGVVLRRGGGVLLGRTTAIFLAEEYKGVMMMEIHQCGMGKMRIKVNFLR
jgi:hypothetical protein